MTKNDFLKTLSKALSPLQTAEKEKSLLYYREIIDDRMEEGIREEDVIAGLEDVKVIAEGILSDAAMQNKLKPKGQPHSKALIILGSPLWLILLLAVGAVMVSMYMTAWALIIAMFSVVAALGLCGVVGCLVFVMGVWGNPVSALFQLGAGWICAGVGILLFPPVLYATKWLIRSTGRAWRAVWGRLGKEKGEAR